MFSILKKMAFAILIVVAGPLKAQIPGNRPLNKTSPGITRPTAQHSISEIRADLIKRYPQFSARLSRQAPLSAMHRTQSLPSLEQIRQNLIRRYPQLQQQINGHASSRTLSMGNRGLAHGSAPYDRAMIQQHIDKLRMHVEQTRQRNLQIQRQQQQRSIQLQMQQQMQQQLQQPVQEVPVQQLPEQQRPMQQQPVQQQPVQQPPVQDQIQLPTKASIPSPRPKKQIPIVPAVNK